MREVTVNLLGVAAGSVSALIVLAIVFLALRHWRRRKVPPSPNFDAVGSFEPSGTVFKWESSISITRSYQEEPHTVQPRYVSTPMSDDDVTSVSSATSASTSSGCNISGTRGSVTSRTSLLAPRNRTMSEISEASLGSCDAVSISGLNPDLYAKRDLVLQRQQSGVASLGRLHFRLKYDHRTSDLILHLIEAQDLDADCHFPFVQLQLLPAADAKLRQSSIRRQSASPVFDEYFKWPLVYDELRERHLRLLVYDFDRYSHNALLGEVRLDLGATDLSTSAELWGDIEPQADDDAGCGELLVSVSYLPAAERLTAIVMKARNLQQQQQRIANKLDPVVRTTLIIDGKVSKRKRTSVVKATTNPVWNEAHVFSLPNEQLDRACVEFAVLHHDVMSTGEPLGQCTIGKGRAGQEGWHWKEMTLNLRKAVAKWHTLRQ